MASPALRALRHGLPDSEIVGISRPGPAALLEGSSYLDQIISYKPRSSKPGENRFGLVKKLRAAELDAVLLFTNSLSSAAIAFLARIPRRIGYVRDLRGWLLTDRVAPADVSSEGVKRSLIEKYLELTKVLGCDSSDRRMELPVAEADVERAKNILGIIGFDSRRPLIVINNSAAAAKSRIWPQQYVVHLCRQLSIGLNCQILIHCGPNDRDEANAISQQVNNPLVQSMGEWHDVPLSISKAVISLATIVVSSDSGPRHIAAALNRPIIGLYGPTDSQSNRTFNIEEVVLESFLECRPCNKTECPLKHHRCMRNIEVDTVRSAIENILLENARLRLAS